ncbi:GGDEF domain-containing protein, diguanylate cyclase (c-di-GMP synthetase) or its enzymatically inactive variants [Butyrivibrio sp. ob235]|uniref:sensor domain-containing diguanylate cyclase n=1 Tax=Butyrivibrio sp. ob235 TaxID=1761780 RepID=UPI0008D0EDFD|nr:GGDEF domain-containing protein [Butyrivibrio sp. ob235]SEL85033.1 GGDEF domain-containing protein, diguanylate cyclase (c-di-GMP synthetase) or its enzymatically inactive variants [Butyrivibrio sp. ob235]
MKKDKDIIKSVYWLLFGFIMMLIFVMVPIRSDIFTSGYTEHPVNFSKDWRMGGQKISHIQSVMAGEHGGQVILEKGLPTRLTEKDSLCFESQNTNLSVFLDNVEIYKFTSTSNLTGTSTGIVFHEVGLGSLNVRKTIKIASSCCYEGQKTGRIMNVYICPPSDYMRLMFHRMLVPCLLCVLMILFGLIQILVYFSVIDKSTLPFNILALGTTSLIAGTWLFIDTNIMQLLTGSIYAWRDMSKTLPFWVGYPLVTFFNSTTVKQSSIYHHLSFWLSMVFELSIISARYLFNLDMAYSFSLFLIPYFILIMGIMVIIAIDNANYCRIKGIVVKIRDIYFVLILLLVCGLVDLVRDYTAQIQTDVQGLYTRAGMVILIAYMMFRFLKWWTKDHAQIQRERFINHALQYALSSDSPENNIKAMLDFMGKELEANRIFIFEDQKTGKFRGSYEWCREGLKPESIELIYLPYDGFLDKFYDTYVESGRRLIVSDIQQVKASDPYFYDLLKNYKVENLVIGALQINGKLTGLCGVSGAPREKLVDIAEIINLISYFLAQLILQREEQKRLFYYNYNDALSGARNHMAYRKFMESGLDMSAAFGYMRAEILGLEDINREKGYDAGDRMVIDVAKTLMEIFGEANVYRLNGNVFVCFGFETEESYFENDVECARRMIEKKDIKITMGSAYCVNGTTDMEIIFNRVDELLQENNNGNLV